MNQREKLVLVVLTALFLVGTGISLVRKTLRQQAGSHLVVTAAAVEQPATPGLVDLNRASRYQLEALPGIGPVIAGRILAYRRLHGGFRKVAELRRIPGIGPKRYAMLRQLVYVGPVVQDTAE